MRKKHKPPTKEMKRKEYLKNRNRYLESAKNYYEKNKEKIKEWSRGYVKKRYAEGYFDKYKEAMKTSFRASRKKTMQLWLEILTARGMLECSLCGYNKCTAAIEYHHKSPDDKESQISHLLNKLPSPKSIAELEKCIPLCANCHREFHHPGRGCK